MDALSDDQLVVQAQKGDVDAFTNLALRHQEKIFQASSFHNKLLSVIESGK